MTRIRGLLFDKDGTLLDFAASWTGVLDATLGELTEDAALRDRMAAESGYDRAAGTFQPGSVSVAGSLDELAEMWAAFLPALSARDVEAVANRIATAAVHGGALVPAVPDMAGFLADLRGSGYLLGIATHDSEAAARAHMASLGSENAFDFISGYDSGHGLKPGPGMLLAFARATGLAPAEIAMIGDSIHDLGVAPAAGAGLAIGVLTGPAGPDDLAELADHILPSIGDLPALLATLSD